MPKLKQEQITAINHEAGNILISASAGSGKTFVMIERLIRLIREKKANIDEILAVTFTESAAADMKEKLKKALKKSVDEGDTSLARVIPEVATADISTLHAFCGRLIRKYFFTVGLSPDFAIADQNQALLLKNESIDKTFKQFYSSKEKWFNSLVDKFSSNRSDKGLKELILKMHDYFSAEAHPLDSAKVSVENLSQQNFDQVLQDYTNYFKLRLERLELQAETALSGARRFGIKDGESFCRQLIDDIRSFKSMDLYKVKELEKTYKLRLAFGKNLSLEALEYKELAKSTREKVVSLFESFSKHLTDRQNDREKFAVLEKDSQDLFRILSAFSENYDLAKREENVLDFSDLEHFALKILCDEQVCLSVSDKYKYVFVDEYQDVNGVQEELISKITKDNLFMVGDVKQSIYGFRGCRADFFSNKMEQMPKLGQKTLQLDYNFRSADKVIEMVNAIFNYSMTQDRFGMDYSKSLLLAGGIYKPETQGRAQIHALIKQKKERVVGEKPRLYNVLDEINNDFEEEDVDVASLVTDIINRELGKKFYDPKTQTERQVTLGDIAILTRNRENKYVTDLVNGLVRHGVPVVSEISQSICDFPEVSVLINVLKLMQNFSGDVALATTLKSFIGKFTEEDLAEIVLFYKDNFKPDKEKGEWWGGFYDAYVYYIENANSLLNERLKEFDDYFKKIRFIADFAGAHDVLEKLVADKGIEAELYAQRLGDVKVKRVRKFISESVSQGKKLTVNEFLSLIEDNKDAFGLREVAEENTVKIMTMHASKGLEFPVVIVCGLERKINHNDAKESCLFDRKYGFAIKYFDVQKRTAEETLTRGLIKEKEREESVKEELRLFYVATTRATYSLHLTMVGEPKKTPQVFVDANCFADCLPSNLEVTLHDEQDLLGVSMRKDVTPVLFGKPDENVADRIKTNFAFDYAYKDDTLLPLKSTATKEIKVNEEQTALTHYVVQDEETGSERGIIAHKLMEHFDFEKSKDVKEQARRLIESGVLTQKEVDSINLDRIQKVFDNGVFEGVKTKKLYREKSFISSVDASFIRDTNSTEKVVVQGIIDLLVVDGKKAQIIDYKYSTLTPESLKIKYAKQLGLYAQAVKTATGMNVEKTTLVNLFTGDVVAL